MIKIYVHYNSLVAFNQGKWINAKLQFIGQYDIELLIDLNNIVISYQQNGFTIRKRKWYEKFLRIKNAK
jgi:hypothetical protein